MRKNKKRNQFQRDSLRESLSRQESISPEAGIDSSEFSRSSRVRVYKKRWLILLLYIMFVFGTMVQWLQYTIIQNAVVRYYKVSLMAVKATAMIYSISFVVLLYPMTWLIHKKGVKFICVVASASICLGTWIKYFGIYPDQFSLILIGQCFVGAWQLTVVSLPATVAATWFGPNEVATAMAIGNSGTIFGVVLSAILGPIIIKNHEGAGDIGKDLNHYTLPLGFYTTCVLFLMYFFFTEQPKFPPSRARALQNLCVGEEFDFFKNIFRLLKNGNYILLCNAHGLITGGMIAVNVSLNTLYIRHFKNGEQDVGRIFLLFILIGFCGLILSARILDRFKTFKLSLVILSTINILTTLLIAVSMYFEIRWTVYVSVAVFGFIASGYYTTSFETCAELTYPEPATICVTLMNLANQIYSAIFVVCLDKLIVAYSDMAAYGFLLAASMLGWILTCVIRDERRRESAEKLQSEMEFDVK